MKRFLTDLKTLTSRSSKFQKSLVEEETGRTTGNIIWEDFLMKHPQFLDLYHNHDDDGGTSSTSSSATARRKYIPTSPLQRLISKVGPMKRSKMEKMIYSHPKFMYDILSSDFNGIKSIAEHISGDLELNPLQTQKIDNVSGMFTVYRGNIRLVIRSFRNMLQLDKACIARIILKAPKLVNYSHTKIASSIEFFQQRGFSSEEIGKMIASRPMILTYSTGNKIKSVLDVLERDLGIPKCKSIVVRYPQVLTVNADSIVERARFLRSNFHFGCASGSEWLDVSNIISGFPPVLWLSEGNLVNKILFLQKEFDFRNEEMRDILVTFPQMLGLSTETNLRPKIDFLLLPSQSGGAGLSREELKELVLYQPAVLAYSLEGRIKPRVERMKKNFITLSYAPMSLMSFSDTKFDQWLLTQQLTWSIK